LGRAAFPGKKQACGNHPRRKSLSAGTASTDSNGAIESGSKEGVLGSHIFLDHKGGTAKKLTILKRGTRSRKEGGETTSKGYTQFGGHYKKKGCLAVPIKGEPVASARRREGGEEGGPARKHVERETHNMWTREGTSQQHNLLEEGEGGASSSLRGGSQLTKLGRGRGPSRKK